MKNLASATMNRSSPSEEESFLFGMQLIGASALVAALKSALDLDLLELIKKAGPGAFVSPVELTAQIPTTNPEAHVLVDRILRLLAAHKILGCILRELPNGGVERLYSLAPVSKFLTKNDDGESLAPVFLMGQDKVLMEAWYNVKDAVLEGGIPFNRAHGMSGFEYPAKDPRFNNVINQAMSDQSTIHLKRILEIYQGFEGLKSVVDVGGGTGACLKKITSKYPSIKGINFDLPHVIQNAPPHPGVEHLSGDMFVRVPGGDAIFMKFVCHDWSDGECMKILRNCYEALPENGKVIIAERLLWEIPDEDSLASVDFAIDVYMMLLSSGGKERTENEFQALAIASGFKAFRKVCCAFGVWIMEFYK